MKSPIVMESTFSSPITPMPAQNERSMPPDRSIIMGRPGIKQGLLARATVYANNAAKGNIPVNQFAGITLSKRDPIVWGDPSNRYLLRNIEINNSNIHTTEENSTQQQREATDNVPLGLFGRAEWQNGVAMTSSPLMNGELKSHCDVHNTVNGNGLEQSKETDENDNVIKEEVTATPESAGIKRLSFNTTQQLRSGFFRSIKRQYSPILTSKNDEVSMRINNSVGGSDSESCSGQSSAEPSQEQEESELEDESRDTVGNMSQLARQKLHQLRRQGSRNVDVSTGLQWIRLELHEMREQDKSLFLQLIKLHSTIKEVRSEFSGSQEFDSYDDLHSAASLWWPRRGHSSTTLPDFSSSDGAQIFQKQRNKTPLRRGFSVNYPPTITKKQTDRAFMQAIMSNNSIESNSSLNSVDSA